MAGIVAADFGADWYQGKAKQLLFIISTFILFALICSIILAIMITGQYNKFFVTLIDKMNDLSNGIAEETETKIGREFIYRWICCRFFITMIQAR